MRVLVVGQGGREHAIVRALKHSLSVVEVHAAPGNPGFAQEALCHPVDPSQQASFLNFVKQKHFDLIVIGPENYLDQGLADLLRAEGYPVFGPSRDATQLESSKVFSKKFMERAGVPTSAYEVVTSIQEIEAVLHKFTPPYVLKADGLAAGKGVFICKNQEELLKAAHSIFVENLLGAAGKKAILEQFKDGWELSFLVLTNGQNFQALPLAQDHKRLKNGDEGPNTGGMGVVAPLTIDPELRRTILATVVEPSIKQLQSMGLLYRGILYVGLMITADGPSVLEYNVRFGDPEAQALLPLLDGDWGVVFNELAKGNLPELKWRPLSTACVVLAAQGYPESPVKGASIEGNVFYQTPSSYFLHAGTQKTSDGKWQTAGGRVLNSVGIGSSLGEALHQAYEQAAQVNWNGQQMRTDIGHKVTS